MTDLSKAEVLKALAAAEFAAAFSLHLDVLVTLDFGRMGIAEPQEARDELQRFLKAANSWLSERKLPVAWIACIECNRDGGLHAHIATHVPGMRREDGVLHGVRHRTHFRRWAREAIARRVGEEDPKTVNVRCSLVASTIGHWIAVTYLLKGFDRRAVLIGARNSPDCEELRLGDILPFGYRDPGPVGLDRRLFVSGNLGPARRALGAPPGAEFTLAPAPDLLAVNVTCADAKEPHQAGASPFVPRPYRTMIDDGIFDVRRIFGSEFASFVTGIKRSPAPEVMEVSATYDPDLLTFLDDLGV